MFFSRPRDPAQRPLRLLGAGPAASPRGAAPVLPSAGWHQREGVCMGTAIGLQWWGGPGAAADAVWAQTMAEMQRIDALYSPHKATSELSRINREAGHHAVAISEETARLVAQALELSALTDGAFDITYAAAGALYDYREGRAPDMATLRRAREAIGFDGLELNLARGTLRFLRPGMRIDLGGFAKGHAVDGATAALQQRGVLHAHLSAGGDSRVLGDRRGRPWGVAIHDPRAGRVAEAGAAPIAVLPLVDCAVSTSGDYERAFVKDGVRHHHLLDPATGASATGARSVTVIADAARHAGLVTEAWSKALFVLGPTRGLTLMAERAPTLDAVVVDAQGRLHCSRGLAQAMAHPTRETAEA
jgi:thiamine biosynthesis lipoprotein